METVSVEEAARMRGVTTEAIYIAVSRGVMRSRKVNGRRLIFKADVLKPKRSGRPKGSKNGAGRKGKK